MFRSLYKPLFSIAVLFLLQSQLSSAYAQVSKDSLEKDTSFFSYFPESEFMKDTFIHSEPLVFGLYQRYQPQYENLPYLRIGNPGHAQYSPLFSYLLANRTLSSSVNSSYLSYFDQRKNIQYFRNKPPFTALTYMSGAKKEESIDVVHARNFGDNLNFAIHFTRNASIGFYNNLKTRNTYFNSNFNYSTKNHRYTFLTHYYYNKKELQENGGYDDFSTVENPETFSSSRLSRAGNTVQDEGFLLSQTFGFGNTRSKKDGPIRPIVRIGHDLEVTSGYRRYSDLSDGDGLSLEVYENIYFDSTQTQDTNTYNRLSNQVNLLLYPGNEIIKFFYRNEQVEYTQNHLVDTIYQNHITGAEFSIYPFKQYRADIIADYYIDGFQKGDIHFSMDFRKRRTDTLGRPSLLTNFYYYLENPQFKELRYFSNNFIWYNDFNKSEKLGVTAGIDWKGYALTGDLGRIARRIYYDEKSLPAQFNESIEYLSVGLTKRLKWRNIYLDNVLRFQQSSEQEILPVPELLAHESIYFQNFMFKKVVEFRVGFDVFYFTGFKGLAYMPATGEFHLQNSTVIGNYPFIDLFFTFRLKRAFFFIKIEHFNKGMAGSNFYQVPDYPVPPRAFKWGLKWTLFD